MIVMNLYYKINSEYKQKFLEEIFALEIPQKTRIEKGCVAYNFYPSYDKDEILLVEKWESAEALNGHKEQQHLRQLIEIKGKYGIETVCDSFEQS